jgi:hypothetical protein
VAGYPAMALGHLRMMPAGGAASQAKARGNINRDDRIRVGVEDFIADE